MSAGWLKRPSQNETITRQSPRRTRRQTSEATLFPKPVPDCSLPKRPVGDGEKGKIALNEWLLPDVRVDRLNGQVWVNAPCATASGQTQLRTFTSPPRLPNYGHSFISAL